MRIYLVMRKNVIGKSEKKNRSDNRTQVECKRENWLVVFGVALGFPSAAEERSGSDVKKPGPLGQLG